ncbi:hypothetical protein C5167_039165 [Papaver somniferum]|uniref:Uncharacterized protein n=1 Tax=Papaver somniferum TaxID=3469 RepID=A0A4Y7IBB8_PAPSO|nr:hypothetical protein C5167_039165 [Papaver somniferum]
MAKENGNSLKNLRFHVVFIASRSLMDYAGSVYDFYPSLTLIREDFQAKKVTGCRTAVVFLQDFVTMYANIMKKYVKNPVRSFRVEECDTNKVRFFYNISANSGGLNGFSDVVHAAYQLPPIKKVSLTWFSDTDTFYIDNNKEFFEMWDKGVVEDDGYIHLYMNVTNRKVPLSDECPSPSYVSVSKSLFSTPEKVQSTSRIHIERGATPVKEDYI